MDTLNNIKKEGFSLKRGGGEIPCLVIMVGERETSNMSTDRLCVINPDTESRVPEVVSDSVRRRSMMTIPQEIIIIFSEGLGRNKIKVQGSCRTRRSYNYTYITKPRVFPRDLW